MTQNEFDKLVDAFGRKCGQVGASDPRICFDPFRDDFVAEANEMRAKIKAAFAEERAATSERLRAALDNIG